MAQAASKSCEICVGSIGRHYCQQCDQIFCENCRIAHLRIKTTKNHTIVSGRNINPEEKPLCSKHDKPLIFHCLDCDTVVCQRCVVQEHNRHNKSSIKESVLKLKKQLTKSVNAKCKDLNNDINQIKQGNIDFQSDAKAAINFITEDAKRMKDWIDTNAEEIIKSVKEIELKNCRILSTANDEFNDTFIKINKVRKTIADTSRMSDVALLPKVKRLQTKINRLVTTKVPSMPTIKYHRKKLSKNNTGKLFGKLTSREAAYLENTFRDRNKPKKATNKTQHGLILGTCQQEISEEDYDDGYCFLPQEAEEEQDAYERTCYMMEKMADDQYNQGYGDVEQEAEEEQDSYERTCYMIQEAEEEQDAYERTCYMIQEAEEEQDAYERTCYMMEKMADDQYNQGYGDVDQERDGEDDYGFTGDWQ